MTDFIDQAWRSGANQDLPQASFDAARALAGGFARRDIHRRRRLWITGMVLGLFSLGAGMAVFDRAAPQSVFGAIGLLAMSWALWGLLLAQGRPDGVALHETRSFLDSLQAMRRRNRRERRSLAQMAVAILLAIFPLWLTTRQLQAAGQASPGEALQLGGLLSLALVAGAGFLLVRLATKLAPEGRRLDRLIADHASD